MTRHDGGLIVLGAPIGCLEFIQETLDDQVQDIRKLVPSIVDFDDSQRAMVLLRMCFAQKFTYALRTVPSEAARTASVRFDIAVEECFRGLLGIHQELTRHQWQQIILETKHGGFGIQSASKTCRAAYTASVAGCMKNLRQIKTHFQLEGVELDDLEQSQTPLVRRWRTTYQELQAHIGEGGVLPDHHDPNSTPFHMAPLAELPDMSRGLQRKLNEALSQRLYTELYSTLPRRDKQRLDSCAREGGAWLACIPKTTQQELTRMDFIQRAMARLGMDLPGLVRMPCVCRHGTVDPQGFHFTAQCPVGNQRFRTHDAIAVTWVALLKEAGFLCRMEDPSCFREVEDTNKRADVVVDNWVDGNKGIFDVSITHPWIQSANRADKEGRVLDPEKAASIRESEKIRKYAAKCPPRTEFIPLVAESYGRWGPRARRVFDICTDKIAITKAMPKSATTAYWRQRFSITLQKYIAMCVRERGQRVVLRETVVTADEASRVDYRNLAFSR